MPTRAVLVPTLVHRLAAPRCEARFGMQADVGCSESLESAGAGRPRRDLRKWNKIAGFVFFFSLINGCGEHDE